MVVRHRVAAVLLFLLVFPLLMPYEALAVNILIYGLYAVGYNLLFGYTGMLSFGHAAFFGVGSYITGIAIVHFGLHWLVAIVAGVAAAAFVGLVIGYLAIRTRGIYFAMVTLALAQIVYYLFYKAERWTGGENGLRGITVAPFEVFGLHRRLSRPDDQVLPDLRLRRRRAVVRLAGAGLAVRRGHRGRAREREAHRGLRLRRRPHQAAGVRAVGHPLRPGRRAARAAPVHRADRLAALPAVRPGA